MGETEEDGAKPLRQPKKDGSQKPIRQAENEIPVFALFAILANMDPRTVCELIAKLAYGIVIKSMRSAHGSPCGMNVQNGS